MRTKEPTSADRVLKDRNRLGIPFTRLKLADMILLRRVWNSTLPEEKGKIIDKYA